MTSDLQERYWAYRLCRLHLRRSAVTCGPCQWIPGLRISNPFACSIDRVVVCAVGVRALWDAGARVLLDMGARGRWGGDFRVLAEEGARVRWLRPWATERLPIRVCEPSASKPTVRTKACSQYCVASQPRCWCRL